MNLRRPTLMTSRALPIWLALWGVLTVVAPAAQAQPSGAALQACANYAKGELTREGTGFTNIVLDADDSLLQERYGRKLGRQPISTVISGRGAIVLEGAPSVELRFVCLLESGKRALFFFWAPRTDASTMRRCSREGATPESTRKCVDALLAIEEMGLTQVSALRFQESLAADATAGNEDASNAYRASATAWRAYRDAECARRARETAATGRADLVRISCMTDLTRKRFEDLRGAP